MYHLGVSPVGAALPHREFLGAERVLPDEVGGCGDLEALLLQYSGEVG